MYYYDVKMTIHHCRRKFFNRGVIVSRSFRTLRAVLVLALIGLGCRDTLTAPASGGSADAATRQYIERLVALGFDSKSIVQAGDGFLIEDDIAISRHAVDRMWNSHTVGRLLGHYRSTNYVTSPGLSYNIKIDLRGLLSDTAWHNAATVAVGHWNGMSTSFVRFVLDSVSPDITVVAGAYHYLGGQTIYLGSATAGAADFPPGDGTPGDTITLNPGFSPGVTLTHAIRVRNVVHEIGHAIGLRHTNWANYGSNNNRSECFPYVYNACDTNEFPSDTFGAVHIGGTPSTRTYNSDPSSVFNGKTAAVAWNGFSTHDLAAIRGMYPVPYPAVSDAYPGAGYPVFTWPAMPHATSYTMQRCYEVIGYHPEYGSFGWGDCVPVGTTSGTTLTDSSMTFTGMTGWSCEFHTEEEQVWRQNYYTMEVTYPTRWVGIAVMAEVFTCNSVNDW
jgi:hypothetical protein